MSTANRASAHTRAESAAEVSLRALLLMYAAERGIGKGRRQQLNCALRWWQTALLREPTTRDLTPDAVGDLYRFLFSQGVARGTIEKHREKIRCLARYAADKGLAPLFELPTVVGRPMQATRVRDKMLCIPPGTVAHYYRHTWLTARGDSLSTCVREEYEAAVNHWLRFHNGREPRMAAVDEPLLQRFRQHLIDAGRGERVGYRAAWRIRTLLQHAEPERWGERHAHNKTVRDAAPEGSLRDFFERTYLPEHDIRPSTADYYRLTIDLFASDLGREPMIADLTDQTVNDFLARQAKKYSPAALRGYRNSIVGFWKSAFQWELTDIQPRRVRRVKVPPTMPDAWTFEEAARLIAAADQLPGKSHGIPRRLLLRAWMLAQYDTAFRTADMLALRRKDINWATGVVTIRQQKTGDPTTRRLRPDTLEAVLATFAGFPERERLFPLSDDRGRKTLYKAGRQLLKLAGLPIERRNGPQKWRRTSATHLARAAGIDAATDHLGHRSPELARRYYLDATQAFAPPPLPPALPLRQPVAGLLPAPSQEGGRV